MGRWRSAVGAVTVVAAAAAAVGPHRRHGYGAVALVVVVTAGAAAVIDRRERRIPNRLVAGGLVVLAVAVVIGGIADRRPAASGWGALAGAAVYAGPLLALHLVSPAAIGFGDVKLGALLGAGLGAGHPVLAAVGLVAACAAAPLHRVLVRRRRGSEPFAPSMAVGAAVVLAFAPWLVRGLGFGWLG